MNEYFTSLDAFSGDDKMGGQAEDGWALCTCWGCYVQLGEVCVGAEFGNLKD